jgi:hypothetical protein
VDPEVSREGGVEEDQVGKKASTKKKAVKQSATTPQPVERGTHAPLPRNGRKSQFVAVIERASRLSAKEELPLPVPSGKNEKQFVIALTAAVRRFAGRVGGDGLGINVQRTADQKHVLLLRGPIKTYKRGKKWSTLAQR